MHRYQVENEDSVLQIQVQRIHVLQLVYVQNTRKVSITSMTAVEESSSVCCSAMVVRALFSTVSTFRRAFLSCLRAPHSNFSALTVLLAARASLTALTRSAGRTKETKRNRGYTLREGRSEH